MGRGYIVEELVDRYLSNLKDLGTGSVTGLLVGQSAPQRDYVILAVQTPIRETEGGQESQGSKARAAGRSLDDQLDMEWVTEHARQVSRMLPGGLSVLGVFLLTSPELAKEAQSSLRRLVFAVDKLISRGRLWSLSEDDITDRVTLHICSTTRKMVCRTFDVRDPKSSAKPADWKYQGGVCVSWPVVTCSVELDLWLPLETTRTPEQTERCIKKGLQTWVQQIEGGVCLLNSRLLSEEAELLGGGRGGQKRNMKPTQQTFRAQLLLSEVEPLPERTTVLPEQCEGSFRVRGVVSCRAYLHSNKPRAKQAVELIKRDIISTVTSRIELLLEDQLMSEGEDRGSDQAGLPVRVFAPAPCGGVCVCDYMFSDDSLTDVSERIREMLDWDTPPGDIDSTQEVGTEPDPEVLEGLQAVDHMTPVTPVTPLTTPTDPPQGQSSIQYYAGVAMAAAVALLATATSLLYLSD